MVLNLEICIFYLQTHYAFKLLSANSWRIEYPQNQIYLGILKVNQKGNRMTNEKNFLNDLICMLSNKIELY